MNYIEQKIYFNKLYNIFRTLGVDDSEKLAKDREEWNGCVE